MSTFDDQVPYPVFVDPFDEDAQRRWDASVATAMQLFGKPEVDVVVQQAARTFFADERLTMDDIPSELESAMAELAAHRGS